MKINKVILTAFFVLTALSFGACNNDGSSDKTNTTTDNSLSVSRPIVSTAENISCEIVSNTFENITDMKIYSDYSNVFFSVINAKNTLDVPDGTYSSPNVTATVNGENVTLERTAYINVSGENISMSVSFNGGFVKKGSEIYVSVENFNKLREPKDETDFVGYDEYTDEVVFKGKLEISAKTDVDFGNYCFDYSQNGAGILVVSGSNASFSDALNVLGTKPSVDDIVLVTKAGTQIKFDSVSDLHNTDDEGNRLDQYTAIYSFDDDRKVDLAEIDDILLLGESLLK